MHGDPALPHNDWFDRIPVGHTNRLVNEHFKPQKTIQLRGIET